MRSCRSATPTRTATAFGGPLIGVGRYIAQGLSFLDKETGQGLPALDWTYGAHGVIVDVDPETGEFSVLKIASVFDVGRVINPGMVRGQCVGGMVQGLGTALCEGYIYDEQGHLLNPSFTDKQGPDRQDVPEVVESYVVQTPQPIDNWICETPRGSRRSHQFEQYHPSEDVPAS